MRKNKWAAILFRDSRPRETYFTAMLVVGKKEKEPFEAMLSECSKELGEIYRQTKDCAVCQTKIPAIYVPSKPIKPCISFRFSSSYTIGHVVHRGNLK